MKFPLSKNDRIEAAFFHAGYVSGMLRGFFFRARKSWKNLEDLLPFKEVVFVTGRGLLHAIFSGG